MNKNTTKNLSNLKGKEEILTGLGSNGAKTPSPSFKLMFFKHYITPSISSIKRN